MDGFRILEDGSPRVTEDSIGRITERYIELSASLTGTGSFDFTANLKAVLDANLLGTGSISASTNMRYSLMFGPMNQVDVERILENGDVRITEESDTRITVDYFPNIGYSSLLAEPSITLFLSEPYAKYQSNWLRAVPYVKYEGEWVVPEKAWKKIGGVWKRIF